MDPNTCLQEALSLAQHLLSILDHRTDEHPCLDVLDTENVQEAGEALAERLLALDQWLSKGGFLPQRWER